MGNFFTRVFNNVLKNVSRKRKIETLDNDDDHEVFEPEIKRFRIDKSLNQADLKSDVVLLAFGRKWHLNRSVLSQSDFFKTLFNGCFKESKLREVEIFTNDELITETSFQNLLNLMYNKEMTFSQDNVFNMTVTAQYFQMHDIVDFCEDTIAAMIRNSNAIDIYYFADRYYLNKTKKQVFQWMLLRFFPVKCWDQLKYLSEDLIEKLIKNPRLVVTCEMYLYFVLKIFIQIRLIGTCEQDNESFYKRIRKNPTPFLSTKEGEPFRKLFEALRMGNILVTSENVQTILCDNIIPRSYVDKWIFKNWMSLISIESPDNFGPSKDLITKDQFESFSMRFAKVIPHPDYHSWKFVGFSFAFDLALFFDGRTLIIKRVHQINEHKVSHSHLLRRIMIRFDIAELNSSSIERQEEIQTFTMTTNEELCLKHLKKELKYPCRISIEVLFHIPHEMSIGVKRIDLIETNDDQDLLKSTKA